MMNVTEFLNDRLKVRREYVLSEDDKKLIAEGNIARFIIQRLTTGKYRKNPLDEVTKTNVERKVRIQVEKNEPIRLTFPFGGYKNHLMPSCPNIDWAELFVTAYFADYMNQIAPVYKPGVVLEFCSDEVLLEKLDNIAPEESEAYTKGFKEMLSVFARYLPENIKIDYVRVRDLYENEEDLWKELAEKMEGTKNNWDGFDESKKEHRISMFRLNYLFDEGKGWDQMTEEERNNLMKENTAMHDAYLSLSKRVKLLRGDDKILIFPTPLPDCLSLGSTRYSVAKFWSGFGVVKVNGENLEDYVMSPDKLGLSSFEEELVEGFEVPGFEKIRVYK